MYLQLLNLSQSLIKILHLSVQLLQPSILSNTKALKLDSEQVALIA